ncbi:MAG: GIY-YIG nuclease family protein, partial [Selenomonadaceae bacterium]|nr:GIY-YIG nuclease family protein [Selenomonadaceae bacterium]
DLTARMKDLQKETKADVIDWVVSALMTRDEALLLERALKAKFFDYIVSGEFFNCDFEAVKAALKGSPVDKLLEIAREMEPSPEKNTLLLQAAALLA